MNFKILSLIALSVFLLSFASAVVVYADFDSGNQIETINLGESISFNAYFFSMNPPITAKIQLYYEGNLIHTFLNTNTNSKVYYNTYSYIPNQTGNYEIEVIGSDNVNTDSEFLTLTVASSSSNHAPVIQPISNQNINEGETYSYQVVATDSDGDDLTYVMNGEPSGFSISSSGLISGVALSVNSNTNYNIEIIVSDGEDFDTETFVLTIVNVPSVNHAPVITSSPVTSVTEGKDYTYNVQATDSDGDALSYDLILAPEWLNINEDTGKVYGTVPYVSSNTEYDVTVEVSDGENFVLQHYMLTVKNVALRATGGNTRSLSEPDIYYPNKYFDQYNPDTVIYSKPTTQKILGLNALAFFYILIALISIGIAILVFLLGKNLRR